MTVDRALGQALARARRVLNEDRDGRLVHDLAIRGAEAVVEGEARRRQLLAELADPDLTSKRLDLEALSRVRAEDEAAVEL